MLEVVVVGSLSRYGGIRGGWKIIDKVIVVLDMVSECFKKALRSLNKLKRFNKETFDKVLQAIRGT